MAKSQIIKDLANGTVDLHTSLKRAKLIFQEIGSNDLNCWIKNELEGYRIKEEIPEYRKMRGSLVGCYLSQSGMKCQNVAIPTNNVDEDVINGILVNYAKQSVFALQHAIAESHSFERPLDDQECKYLSQRTGCYIYKASVQNDNSTIVDILPQVESILMELLCYIEKQFGNLDDLDINVDSKSEEELKEITKHVCVIIYNDQSITIGDKNKINGSTIASNISNELKKIP